MRNCSLLCMPMGLNAADGDFLEYPKSLSLTLDFQTGFRFLDAKMAMVRRMIQYASTVEER